MFGICTLLNWSVILQKAWGKSKVKSVTVLSDCALGEVIAAFVVICIGSIQGDIAPFQTKTIGLPFKWPRFKPSNIIIRMTLPEAYVLIPFPQ